MTKTFPILLLSVVLAGMALSSAFGGGLWLYEEATPDMGVGGCRVRAMSGMLLLRRLMATVG